MSEDRNQLYARERATLEVAHATERSNFQEQIENLSAELRAERIASAKRLQETEETYTTQINQQIEELKARALTELQRRVAIAVENALQTAAAEAEDAKQQALNEARIAFNDEKRRGEKLLEENYNARLQEELKTAHEQGKQVGFKEGAAVAEKTTQVFLETQSQMKTEYDNQRQEFERQKLEYEEQRKQFEIEMANQRALIQSLSAGKGGAVGPVTTTTITTTKTMTKGFSLAELGAIIRGIVNESFKAVVEEFDRKLIIREMMSVQGLNKS